MKFLAAALVFLCAAGLAVGKVIDYQKLVPLASINLAALGGKVKHLENADAPIIKKALHAAVEGTVLELHFLSHEDSVVNQPAAGLAGGVVCTTNAQSPETWLAIYVALLVAAQKNSVCHMHPKNKCNALKDLLGAKVELCGHPYKLSLGYVVLSPPTHPSLT